MYKPCIVSQYPLGNQEEQLIKFIFADHEWQPSNNLTTDLFPARNDKRSNIGLIIIKCVVIKKLKT